MPDKWIDMDDIRDVKLLLERTRNWCRLADAFGPRVGDFIKMKDGSLRRFTHSWHEGLQTTSGIGSFYIAASGVASYSGALDPIVKRESIKETRKMRTASFWFFHHEEHRAHNGIKCLIPCRIYEEV